MAPALAIHTGKSGPAAWSVGPLTIEFRDREAGRGFASPGGRSVPARISLQKLGSSAELDSVLGDRGQARTFSRRASPWKCTASGEQLRFSLGARRVTREVALDLTSPGRCYYWCADSGGDPQAGGERASILEYPLGPLLSSTILARLGMGVMFHAACFELRSRCYVLCGVSGAGKSTVSNLLRRNGAFRVLTDERSIVFPRDGRLFASGSPWAGTAGIAERGEAPLAGVFFLKHAEENHVEPMPPADAATELFRTCFPTFWYRPGMEYALEFCIRVAREVPCRVFGFRPDGSAADFLLDVLSKEASRC